jgi:hypothetical protein
MRSQTAVQFQPGKWIAASGLLTWCFNSRISFFLVIAIPVTPPVYPSSRASLITACQIPTTHQNQCKSGAWNKHLTPRYLRVTVAQAGLMHPPIGGQQPCTSGPLTVKKDMHTSVSFPRTDDGISHNGPQEP